MVESKKRQKRELEAMAVIKLQIKGSELGQCPEETEETLES